MRPACRLNPGRFDRRRAMTIFALTGPLMSTLGGRRSIATMDAAFGGAAEIQFEGDRRATDRKDRGEVVRGRSLFGDPGLAHGFENARFFILVADVHRRVAPIETSLEWLLLFASHQNVINSRKMLGLV